MADDLDDGELWLPSDIVPDLGLRRYPKSPPSSDLALLDAALARRLAALRLLAPTRFPKPESPDPLLPFHSRLRLAQLETLPGVFYNGVAAAKATRPVGSGMVYGLNQAKPARQPAPVQLDGGFEFTMARVTPRQQAIVPARYFPVRTAGSRARGSGTGVFLPRVVNNESRKKHSVKGEQQQQQKQATRNAASMKQQQGVTLKSPSSEMGLPHDWTY